MRTPAHDQDNQLRGLGASSVLIESGYITDQTAEYVLEHHHVH